MSFSIPRINDLSPHWQYFKMLYRDVEKSFEYVHPTGEHLQVYSVKYYEYLLRACTEFESVCKSELFRAELAKPDEWLNIKDYSKLEAHYDRKLSSYEVGFRFDLIYFVRPLGAWSDQHSLSWYQSYNAVKHHRAAELGHASLNNVLHALAGLFVVLLAAKLCPAGNLAFGGKELLRWNEEWPMVIRKDIGEHVYNKGKSNFS